WILPQVVLIFMAIYGLSALAIREFALRIKGGPATVFILGLAFGIVTEGMAAHSLFNPGWPDAGVLGSYGRWEGVNWLWTEWIVPFHAVWSISFPIFLTGRFWPDSRSVRFLSDRWLVGLAPVPVVVAVVTGQVFAGYSLSWADWLGMGLALVVLVIVAWRWVHGSVGGVHRQSGAGPHGWASGPPRRSSSGGRSGPGRPPSSVRTPRSGRSC